MKNYKHYRKESFLNDIFQNKKKLIIIFMIIAIVLSLLTITLANVCGDNKNNIETAQVASEDMERSLEEFNIASDEEDDSEISIEDLPEETQEDKEEKNGKDDKNKQQNNKNSGNTYFIRVNYGANVVTVYSKDEEGNYTVPVKAMVCSTGTATPKSGTYATKGKYRWIALFGNVYGQYSMQIVGNILFHSVPYLENRNPGSLEYWEYDKLGTSASMGCVRLKVSDAKWIYDNISRGTMVEFYSDSNPGPLGKPGSQKISSNEICRGWDPTDPDTNNPWYNTSKKEEKKQEPMIEIKEEPKKEPEVKPETNTNINNTTEEKQDNTNDNNTDNNLNNDEVISDNISKNN